MLKLNILHLMVAAGALGAVGIGCGIACAYPAAVTGCGPPACGAQWHWLRSVST